MLAFAGSSFAAQHAAARATEQPACAKLPLQSNFSDLLDNGKKFATAVQTYLSNAVAAALQKCKSDVAAVMPENWRAHVGCKVEDVNEGQCRQCILANPALSDGRFHSAITALDRWRAHLATAEALLCEAGLTAAAKAAEQLVLFEKEVRALKGTTSVLHTVFIKCDASYIKRYGVKALSDASTAIQRNIAKEGMNVPHHLLDLMNATVASAVHKTRSSTAAVTAAAVTTA